MAVAPNMNEQLTREALKLFRIIYGSVRKHSQAVEKACGVGGAQIWAMAALAETPGLRVTELARALAIHPSTASNLLDKMEKAALVRRQRGSADQRVVQLFLTEEGARILDRAPRPLAGVLTQALEQMPEATLKRLGEDLRELIAHLHVADESAAVRPLSEL
jgi:DNA-binding MarR family transcriptional regulator